MEKSDDEIHAHDDAEDREVKIEKKKKRKRISKEFDGEEEEDNRGVCYLSRLPPRMNPSHIRQILSQFGDIQRVYLAAKDAAAQVQKKQSGGFRGKDFSEGWVEFTKKSVAKRVAKMLNGQQIGGKKRSPFYYDLWNIKYLRKFKWDDLTGELGRKKREREEKLKMEISAAKRERDFYMSKVEQSKALKFIKKRREKKQKLVGPESGEVFEPKVMRQFPQNRPVTDNHQSKPKLSRDFLEGVFAGAAS